MLVYVALALAVALVLRRGDGPASWPERCRHRRHLVATGSPRGCSRIGSTRSTIRSTRTGSRSPSDTGTPSGCLSAIGAILAVGVVAHARRAWLALAAGATRSAPRDRSLLRVFARILGRPVLRARRDGRARPAPDHRSLVAAGARCRRRSSASSCVAPGCADDRGRRAALPRRRARRAPPCLGSRGAHRRASAVARVGRRIGSPRARVDRLAFAAAWPSASPRARSRPWWAPLQPSVARRAALTSFEIASRRRLSPAPSLNDRLFSVSGTGRAETIRVAWDAGSDHPSPAPVPARSRSSGTNDRPKLADRPRCALAVRRDVRRARPRRADPARCCSPRAARRRGTRSRHSRFVAPACGAYVAWAGRERSRLALGDGRTDRRRHCSLGRVGLVAAERRRRGSLRAGSRLALVGVTATLSVLAVWSLVGNQALFAGARGSCAQGLERGDAMQLAERSRCSRGRTSRSSCAATPQQAWATAKERCAPIEMPSRRIRATGSRGSGWPRSHAAPREAPRTTGCAN